MLFKIFFLFTLLFSFMDADIVRPVYLEVIQKTSDSYAVLLKVPAKGKNSHPMRVKDIEGCIQSKHYTKSINGSYKDRYTLTCPKGLKGKRIEVGGLENTKRDLLLRMEFLDGTSQSTLLNPAHNIYHIKENASATQVIQTYTWLGFTHILMGFDHLSFVFLLLLIVKSTRRLLWTITAFTLAHSITMAGATLGLVHVSQQPIEAIIALSILFLAIENIHDKQGRQGLTSRYPWVIAFAFGLLHGFGFAGALSEIGLPQNAITLALIFFNIGVELGQLVFVANIVFIILFHQRLKHPALLQKVETVVIYGIGGLSAFWLIDRVLAF